MIGERRTTSLFHFHKLNLDGLFTGPDLFVNQVGHGQYHILSDPGIHNMVTFFRSLHPLSMFPFPESRRIWSEWEILSPSLSPISSIWRWSDHLRPSADQTTHCADRNIVWINRFCWSDNTLCRSWRQRLAINCQLWSYHKVIRSDGGKWGVTTCLPQASNRRLAAWSSDHDHFFLIVFQRRKDLQPICFMSFKTCKKKERNCLHQKGITRR